MNVHIYITECSMLLINWYFETFEIFLLVFTISSLYSVHGKIIDPMFF